MSKVIIKLVKSPIGYEKSQRDTVVALGFKKRRRIVAPAGPPQRGGEEHKNAHLLKVEYK